MPAEILVLDELVVPHAALVELRAAYHERYAPAARARGMTLRGAWRSPPVDLPDRDSTLHFLWSVADVAGWWAMRLGAARADAARDVPLEGDDEKLRWWRFVDGIVTSRKRTFMVADEALPPDV